MNDSNLTITLEEMPSPEDIRILDAGLLAYNLDYVPDPQYRRLSLFIRDEGGVVLGGLAGNTYWDWLYVSKLWLDEKVRGRGLGRTLLAMAEEEAIHHGCRNAHLDTLDFRALKFYEVQGYTVFGVLDDLPPGHKRYFLKKELEVTGA